MLLLKETKCSDSNLVHRNISGPQSLITATLDSARSRCGSPSKQTRSLLGPESTEALVGIVATDVKWI